MATNNCPVVVRSLPTLDLDLRTSFGLEIASKAKKLLNACQTHGFFYLGLTSDPTLRQYREEVQAVMKHYFEQPLEVKMRDARGSDNTGLFGMEALKLYWISH